MNFLDLLKKTKALILKHKIISAIIILILLGAGFWGYTTLTTASGEVRYVLAAVAKGTIISSVSGTGQVSVLDQIDIKSEVSGKVVYINIQKDKEVRAGTLMAQIDSRDAQKAVESAENDLVNAQLSTTDVKGSATDALDTAYDGGLNALTNTYKDLATIKTNLNGMFQDSSYGGSDSDINYYLDFVKFYTDNPSSLTFWTSDAEKKYNDIQTKLDSVEQTGLLVGKNSGAEQIEASLNDTYSSAKTFLDLIRQANNLLQMYQRILDAKSLTTPIKTATTTTQLSNLSAAISSLTSDTSSLLTAKTDITTKKETFAKIGVNMQSQNLSIQQCKNALADAKDTLAKYYMYAPIGGIISSADSTVKTGDTVSSGIVLGSIITKQQIIEISVNEVDAVKIKSGQKVTIAFDALPDITATGSVISINAVGTVSQGVVSYDVKIIFNTQDSRVKPGMSVSVNIITETKQNVLTVPNSAVKSKSGSYYVLVIDQKSAITPAQKAVQIGTADDTNTEIISGLAEKDQVVARTITGTKATSASKTTNRATQGLMGGGGPPN